MHVQYLSAALQPFIEIFVARNNKRKYARDRRMYYVNLGIFIETMEDCG